MTTNLRDRKVVGASEAADVLGVGYNGPKGPREVYDRLVKLLDHDTIDDISNEHIRRGVALEPVVLDLARRHFDPRIVRRRLPEGCPDLLVLRASPDGEVTKPLELIEIKCPSAKVFWRLTEQGMPDSWNVQGQAQLACFPNADRIHYVIHGADMWQTLFLAVERNQDFIDSVLLPRIEKFWTHHVEPRSRPPVLEDPALVPQVIVPDDTVVPISDLSFEEDLLRFKTLGRDIREATAYRKELGQDIMAVMGTDEMVRALGGLKGTARFGKSRRLLNSGALDLWLMDHDKRLDDFKELRPVARSLTVSCKPSQRLLEQKRLKEIE